MNSAHLLALALFAIPLAANASPPANESPWLVKDAVKGHYHERAALAPVSITRASQRRFTLKILARQAHFTCELEFDRSGLPHVVDNCDIEKIDAFGRTQHDVVWSARGPIDLSCTQTPRRQTCIGEYLLEWHYAGSSHGGSEPRTLRLVREK
jgi:hypothetical protein